jgi:hypothetical protein
MGFHELLPHHTMLDDFSQKPPHTFLHLWDVCKVLSQEKTLTTSKTEEPCIICYNII